MANPIYKNYQLQRTLPKLSGNIQLDLIVGFSGTNPRVEQAHLRPISKYVSFVPVVDERIMDRPHHLNIKRFYEKTRSGFFTQPANPVLMSDWPMLISAAEMPNIKYIKEFDDTYFAGCQRMSHKLYGCTHEILVPVWLDQCDGIRFTFHVSGIGPRDKRDGHARALPLDISSETDSRFHNDFIKYFGEFLENAGIAKGTNNVMSINFKQNIASISGLAVESGNFVTRQNLNISRNLLFRERPLLESNSLLTNSFMDYKMICPQLINFNLCFDINDLLVCANTVDEFTRVNVWVTTEVRHNGSWSILPLADFYTNHHYIPKQHIGKTTTETYDVYDDDKYPRNVLDYKNDFMCTAMMHANKMTQSICHWYYADQPEDMLFNVYDGFGAYGDGFEYKHGYGTSNDSNDDVYDEGTNNTRWIGYVPLVQSEQDTANVLHNPREHVAMGYFQDASNFINGIKFTYDPSMIGYDPHSNRNAPRAVYFEIATSPLTAGAFARWTAQSNITTNPSTVAIITYRKSAMAGEDLPQVQNKQMSPKDIEMDWHMYSDMDNRFVVRKKDDPNGTLRAYFDPTHRYLLEGKWLWLDPTKPLTEIITDIPDDVRNPTYGGNITRAMLVRIGGTGDETVSYRNDDNVNGLFVTYLRTPDVTGERHKDDPLYVVFWTKASEKTTETGDGMIYGKLTPDAILLQNIQAGLREYWNKYGPMIDIIKAMGDEIDQPTNLPDMDDLNVIVDVATNVETADVLYFNNSIESSKDITISPRASEIEYFKNNNANSYVYRYAGKIKPAIYPIDWIKGPRVTRKTDDDRAALEYRSWYGRNFIWHKTPIFSVGQLMPPNIAQYINKNIAPTYPSLDYEVVNQMVTSGIYRPNKHGDIMYDEVPHLYLGMTNDSKYKHDFCAADFGFERLGMDNPFSFIRNVLGEDIRSYFKDIPESEWNTIPDTDKYDMLMNDPVYNDKARNAVLNNLFNINLLTGRSSNAIGYWLFSPEYNTYEWPEFKWFGRSYALNIPAEFSYIILMDSNDKATLESNLINNILADLNTMNKTFATLCDAALIRSLYDFYFDLIGTNKDDVDDTGRPLLKYKYNIKATLK